jgi:hypothetical protein
VVIDLYTLILRNEKGKKVAVKLQANDNNHAQAQACDICRAINASEYSLSYEGREDCLLSLYLKKLAYNEFSHEACYEWEGAFTNKNPCVYFFNKRNYLRNIATRYLDIPEGKTVHLKCGNKRCVNPYHFTYLAGKNSKLSGGDLGLLVAYRSQGVSVQQAARALKVHRSTIYRNLNDERFSTRT